MARSPAPSQIRLFPAANFTGGLNLRADAFLLGPNESPDLLDVVLNMEGGFIQRQVVVPYASALPANPVAMWPFETPNYQQIMVATATNMYYTSGGAWTALTPTVPAMPATVKPRATVFNFLLYMVFGSGGGPIRWDGANATLLTQNWNETIGTEGATDGNMPMCRFVASHMGRLFCAYTTEAGVDYPNRIRWSHANFAEDWRQEDFIDIDVGRDGDFITGIAEFRERLYIFKNNSTTILTGFGPQNFQVTTLSQDIGAVSQEAILVTDVGLFQFSWPQGVYLDRGNGPYPIFYKLYPLVRDGWIPSEYRYQIAMGWVNQMLWCSVPYSDSTVNARTYVYNPWIWKNRYMRFLQGPWYPYSLPISAYATLTEPQGQTPWLAANSQAPYVGQLEQNGSQDNWGGGLTNIDSYFRTRWFDIGQEAVFKRWRHPDFALRPNSNAPILVEVRKDYDPSVVYRTFQLTPGVTAMGAKWDDGTGTVGGLWDDGSGTVGGEWSLLPVNAEGIVRGGSMGSARSVQLSLYAPAGQTWGIDEITFRYVPKRVSG